MAPQIEIIINAGSGSVENEETVSRLHAVFLENNVEAKISLAQNGSEIVRLAKRAVQGNAEIICAGGGDGTISAVASEVVNTDKTLGILPLGTLNNFSKDLQIPQNLEESVRVILENHVKLIDVGSVNGKFFVNNSSIGLYPGIVRRREKSQRMGYGKWRAAFWITLRMLKRSPFFAVKLQTETVNRIIKTAFVFVGNNEYEMNFFSIGRRQCLDDGKLSVYFIHRSGRRGLFLLAFRTIFGLLRQTKDFEELSTEKIIIETRKSQILTAFDGEAALMDSPLVYRIHPKSLRVIVPKTETD